MDRRASKRPSIRPYLPNCCGKNTLSRKCTKKSQLVWNSCRVYSILWIVEYHSAEISSIFPHALRVNAENMYYFSALALSLNEPEEGVGLTDSRLRPDQRLMEEGRWDEANSEKQRLEEKQRAVRRRREAEASDALDEGMNQRTGTLVCVCVNHQYNMTRSQHL